MLNKHLGYTPENIHDKHMAVEEGLAVSSIYFIDKRDANEWITYCLMR